MSKFSIAEKLILLFLLIYSYSHIALEYIDYEKANEDIIVVHNSSVINAVPRNKLYNDRNYYDYIDLEFPLYYDSIEGIELIEFIIEKDDETHLNKEYLEIIKQIDIKKFPCVYEETKDGVLLYGASTREGAYYKFYKSLPLFDNFFSELLYVIKNTPSEEILIKYLEYKGIEVKDNTFIIDNITFRYNLLLRTLKICD